MDRDLLCRHICLYIPLFALLSYLATYSLVSLCDYTLLAILAPVLFGIVGYFVALSFGAGELRALSLGVSVVLAAAIVGYFNWPLWSAAVLMPLIYFIYRGIVTISESA